jgi:hypothetical protein
MNQSINQSNESEHIQRNGEGNDRPSTATAQTAIQIKRSSMRR